MMYTYFHHLHQLQMAGSAARVGRLLGGVKPLHFPSSSILVATLPQALQSLDNGVRSLAGLAQPGTCMKRGRPATRAGQDDSGSASSAGKMM